MKKKTDEKNLERSIQDLSLIRIRSSTLDTNKSATFEKIITIGTRIEYIQITCQCHGTSVSSTLCCEI